MEIKIDFERTRSVYRSQLDSFMNCFIMTCSPFEDRWEDLEREAEKRMGKMGGPWIVQAAGFCAYRTIKEIKKVEVQGLRPFWDIILEPSRSLLTNNWFLWGGKPIFEVPLDGEMAIEKEYGTQTQTAFLDISGTSAQLDYLFNNVGGRILDSYGFFTVNNFGKGQWCYRFATKGYLREAILQTQGFALDYLLRHPLDCFYGPFIEGWPESEFIYAGKTKLDILTNILDGFLPRIRERKAFVDAELHRRGLDAERV